MRRLPLLLALLLLLSGCDTGFRQMGPTEHGLRFRRLPILMGGGVADEVIAPGQMALIFPWDSIYRFDTSVKDISWGALGEGADKTGNEFVYSRALDGNELALAVTIRYKLSTNSERLRRLVQEAALNDGDVRALVIAVARADIRTFMNELKTAEFLDKESRYRPIGKIKDSMSQRLARYGIEIERVNLDDFQFERLLANGKVDSSYQDRLNEIQKLREGIEREKSRIETVRAKKQQEYNDVQGQVNRVVAEADGFKKQAKLRGDGYLQAKTNEAKAILSQGKAEVEGLIERINALAGPGGRAILRLELARQLLKSNPKFVLVGDSKEGLEVKRLDTNDLIRQIGVLEGLTKEEKRSEAPGATPEKK